MSSAADVAPARYEGFDAETLATRLSVPRLIAFDEVSSTMDVAHTLAADGTPAGTVVIAETQTAGRGRGGRRWSSARGGGIWLTLIERPNDADMLDVLSLRLGLAAADAVERFADGRVRVKWPNDVYVGTRKLAGVLVEARWRDARPEWVSIGLGMNVVAPDGVPEATGLAAGTPRLAVLEALVPALRTAARQTGRLTTAEAAAYSQRDLAAGRAIVEPAVGVASGVTAAGELRVVRPDGAVTLLRHGSLVFADDQTARSDAS